MAQFARPTADITVDNWTEDDGTAVDLFDQLDEIVADDADYIKTGLAPAGDVYVCQLGSVEDPVASTGHIVRYRYAKDAAGGAQIDLLVELRQGYVSEASQGTLIADWTHSNISETVAAAAHTLASGEADAITDYADLQLRFVATQV